MVRRAATMFLIVTFALWIAPGPAAARADPTGWAPVFSESFDDAGALPAGCSAYDGDADGAQASYFRPEAVTVSDGHLRLALHRGSYGGKSFVTGELRCLGAAQQYGRYEFRARVPVGAGIASMAMLHPVDPQAPQQASQLEITAPPGGEKALVRNGSGTDTSVRVLTGPFSDWHTYTIEWAPSGFRVIIDNKERSLDPNVSTQPRWFGFAVTTGDAVSTGDAGATPGATTALPAEFEIDFLRVYAFAPVNSVPPLAGQPSTVVGAVPGEAGHGPRWSLWLAVAATVMAALALFALVVHRTRPHRPRPSHRA